MNAPQGFDLERWQGEIAKAADRDDALETLCHACRDMAARVPIGDGHRETIKRRLWGTAERHLVPRFDLEAMERVFINAFPEELASGDSWPSIVYALGEAFADQQATIRELRTELAAERRRVDGYKRLLRDHDRQVAA